MPSEQLTPQVNIQVKHKSAGHKSDSLFTLLLFEADWKKVCCPVESIILSPKKPGWKTAFWFSEWLANVGSPKQGNLAFLPCQNIWSNPSEHTTVSAGYVQFLMQYHVKVTPWPFFLSNKFMEIQSCMPPTTNPIPHPYHHHTHC